MEKQCLIHISEGVARNPQLRFAEPVNLDFYVGEHVAIVGANGSGKSLLVDMLTGKNPLLSGELSYDFSPSSTGTAYENIRYLSFRDTYGTADANYYYQQRWNAHDQDEVPLVRDVLGASDGGAQNAWLFGLFGITDMLDKRIIHLSSGELRKFQLAKVLMANPRVLIIDNPFIGLDAETRDLLASLLGRLAMQNDRLQLILVQSIPAEIPPFVTHVVPVTHLHVGHKRTREEAMADFAHECTPVSDVETACQHIQTSPFPTEEEEWSDEVVQLNHVTIRYGQRTILRDVDWTVHRGEKWAVQGANGTGKSTLLSLVCADNPQSYACDIRLFGRKRGTGESIWEIKKRIGYVSPEMHRAYRKNLPAIEIVASGLHDSIGLYKRPHPEQIDVCRWWMDIFGIVHLADRPFLQLSSGEQRLTLLARAFVKDPELLILDEPLHGLDVGNRYRVRRVIETFCQRPGKTLLMVTHYASELPATITHTLRLQKSGLTE